jgi:hypothetical protein
MGDEGTVRVVDEEQENLNLRRCKKEKLFNTRIRKHTRRSQVCQRPRTAIESLDFKIPNSPISSGEKIASH